jgi:hypothetical protein
VLLPPGPAPAYPQGVDYEADRGTPHYRAGAAATWTRRASDGTVLLFILPDPRR